MKGTAALVVSCFWVSCTYDELAETSALNEKKEVATLEFFHTVCDASFRTEIEKNKSYDIAFLTQCNAQLSRTEIEKVPLVFTAGKAWLERGETYTFADRYLTHPIEFDATVNDWKNAEIGI